MKVLIAEDEPTTAHMMKTLVEKHGVVHQAANGQDAYDAYCTALESGEKFDLVLLDIMMPIADDQEVLQAIREYEESKGIIQTEGVQVVMTTCIDKNQEVFEAMASGALEYLTKPLNQEKLGEILKRVKNQSLEN